MRGQVSWDAEATVGDFILLRSTGVPVYNFCVAGEAIVFGLSISNRDRFSLKEQRVITIPIVVSSSFESLLYLVTTHHSSRTGSPMKNVPGCFLSCPVGGGAVFLTVRVTLVIGTSISLQWMMLSWVSLMSFGPRST